MNKVIKSIGGLIVALIVGGLASGVWEHFLSPAFSFISEVITGVLSRYSQSYADSIYASASNLHGAGSTAYVVLFVGTVFSFAMIFYGFHVWLKINFCLEDNDGRVVYSFWAWAQVICGAFIFSMTAFQSSKQSAIKDVRNYSVTNMAIARPYIGDEKYHYLMSDFLRVNNEAEFNEFVENLRETSAKSGIKFKNFRGF